MSPLRQAQDTALRQAPLRQAQGMAVTTVGQALRDGVAFLREKGAVLTRQWRAKDHPEAALAAEVLLRHVLGWDTARLYAHAEAALSPEQEARYRALLVRAAQGEPVAYLVGHKEFYGLDFLVDPRVMIPRPETELLVERALSLSKGLSQGRLARVLDVGTGCGAIAIALAVSSSELEIVASDLSGEALTVARQNAHCHGVGGRITFVQADLLAPLQASFDLIVANLPYVPTPELERAQVDSSPLRYEPRLALDGGPEGLDVLRRLLAQAPARLAPGGALLLEMGPWQAARLVGEARRRFPGARITVGRDLAGRERLLVVATSASALYYCYENGAGGEADPMPHALAWGGALYPRSKTRLRQRRVAFGDWRAEAWGIASDIHTIVVP